MRGSLTTSLQIHYKSIVFSCVWVKYLFSTPCCAPIKDLLGVYLCLSASLSVCQSPNHWPRGDAESIQKQIPPSYSPYPPPPILPPFIHPPLPFHHLPHLSLQCCRSESVCRRGMYVHTNTGRAVISPYANTERLLPALWILINKGISIELLLKLMETDGCCCLQV